MSTLTAITHDLLWVFHRTTKKMQVLRVCWNTKVEANLTQVQLSKYYKLWMQYNHVWYTDFCVTLRNLSKKISCDVWNIWKSSAYTNTWLIYNRHNIFRQKWCSVSMTTCQWPREETEPKPGLKSWMLCKVDAVCMYTFLKEFKNNFKKTTSRLSISFLLSSSLCLSSSRCRSSCLSISSCFFRSCSWRSLSLRSCSSLSFWALRSASLCCCSNRTWRRFSSSIFPLS